MKFGEIKKGREEYEKERRKFFRLEEGEQEEQEDWLGCVIRAEQDVDGKVSLKVKGDCDIDKLDERLSFNEMIVREADKSGWPPIWKERAEEEIRDLKAMKALWTSVRGLGQVPRAKSKKMKR